jgi:hypothetical protein
MMGDASLQLALGSKASGPDNVTRTADDRSTEFASRHSQRRRDLA